MQVALTRSSEDAAATAKRLTTLGFNPVLAPALAIRATGAEPPDGAFDAVIATSAAAFTVLPSERYLRLASLPLYVVGERTAEVAARIGLAPPRAVAPGAATLAALVCDRLPQKSSVLYLAGRDRTGDVEQTLAAARHRVTLCEIYEALAREAWSAEEAKAFAESEAALYYSRRSAEIAVALARQANLSDKLTTILHICISDNAAEPLREIAARNIVVAAQATEAGLFEALKRNASAR